MAQNTKDQMAAGADLARGVVDYINAIPSQFTSWHEVEFWCGFIREERLRVREGNRSVIEYQRALRSWANAYRAFKGA